MLDARLDGDRRQCRVNDTGGEDRESLSGSREELCDDFVDRCTCHGGDGRRIHTAFGFPRLESFGAVSMKSVEGHFKVDGASLASLPVKTRRQGNGSGSESSPWVRRRAPRRHRARWKHHGCDDVLGVFPPSGGDPDGLREYVRHWRREHRRITGFRSRSDSPGVFDS